LIYVDDGSEDDSYALLCELKSRFTRLQVVRHARAVGQSMAVLSGVRQGRGDWLVVLDGDGQNDPADIPPCWRRPRAVSRRTSTRSGSSAIVSLAGMTG
jgi:glycosyltransferase involved in cell wall biosynthesis